MGTTKVTNNLLESGRMLRGYLAGLGLGNNGTDAANDIDIAVGEARNADNDGDLTLASALTKQIDASWAAGTNAGGLSSSLTLTDDTWYHVHLILVTGVADIGFDTSIVAANLVADHSATEYRRIGSVRRGTATNLAFSQVGDEFLWDDPPGDVDVTNLGTTSVTYTLTVPTGLQLIAVINAFGSRILPLDIYIRSLDANDEAVAQGTAPFPNLSAVNTEPGGAISTDAGIFRVRTNTSGQIAARSIDASTTLRIATLGWIDRRGRDD
ncbi:hypothetical protein LCGC14_1733030 [marine sediment metagenome]|uniref:Uncharacterized protein n=1 Tax=marine sediment metagenome TaxID=412755 RepID=A0A0F9HWM8_9ZZZZ